VFAKTRKDFEQVIKILKIISSLSKEYIPYSVIVGFLTAIQPFVNIIMSGIIIDRLIAKSEVKDIFKQVIITLVLNLIIKLALDAMNKLLYIQRMYCFRRISMDINRKILEIDYEHIENPEVHKLKRKIEDSQNGFGGIEHACQDVNEITKGFFSVIISAFVLSNLFIRKVNNNNYFIDSMSFAILVFIIASIVISIIVSKKITSAIYRTQDEYDLFSRSFNYMNYLLTDCKTGKDIRIYNIKDFIYNNTKQLWDRDGVDKVRKISYLDATQKGINGIIATFTNGLVYIFVGLKALSGAFSIGSILKYAGSINEFISNFSTVTTHIADIIVLSRRMQVYIDFFEIPDVKYRGSIPVEKRDDNEYEIEFKNVSFKYPATDNYMLKNISLKLNIGEKLAVVGVNGAGKTTFIKLLCRLYDPTEGEILLNGINIKKYNYEEYLSLFSVVFQDFKLLAFPVGQNIAAGVEYDKDKVIKCCEEAGIGNRIRQMGLDMPLYKSFDETGVEVSGGEAQKIAIARALYKDAPFIVLDEPTAALDPVAEFEIYSKFDYLVNTKTAIYISHRLSSCRFCNNIVVFDNGCIIQKGSHDELIANETGRYYELWNAQTQYYNTVEVV
jgi:ATP-binding cassette subfamily B protein